MSIKVNGTKFFVRNIMKEGGVFMNSKQYSSENMHFGFSYVPVQKFENIYDTCKALKQGTVFRDLDIPFEAYKNNVVMNPFK